MIKLEGLQAALTCDYTDPNGEKCKANVPGYLFLAGNGTLEFGAPALLIQDWLVNFHPAGKREAFCKAHVEHAPRVELASAKSALLGGRQ